MIIRNAILFCTALSLILASGSIAAPTPEDLHNGVPRHVSGKWTTFVDSGKEALRQNDNNLAKRYFLGALDELEKSQMPKKVDYVFLADISTVERELGKLYTGAIANKGLDDDKRIAVRTEQVKTLERITNLNKRIVGPNSLLLTKSQERYSNAEKELEKDQQELKAKEGKESK